MIWKNRERLSATLKRLVKSNGETEQVNIEEIPENIVVNGTPINAENMNTLEKNIGTYGEDTFSQDENYSVGAEVTYQGKLYKAIVEITAGEEFNEEQWEETSLLGKINAIDIEQLELRILKIQNPIGHIRMETTNINPREYLGFGTWVLWGSGRVPVGVNSNDSNFNTVEKTGGEKTVSLTASQNGKHFHYAVKGGPATTDTNNSKTKISGNDFDAMTPLQGTKFTLKLPDDTIADGYYWQSNTLPSGNGSPHNNIQPYITCYMWKRTA